MSIDIDWSQLDVELCARARDGINSLLSSTAKPGFLGDIVATEFSFGSSAPSIELVEIRDVFEEFLHLDEEMEEEEQPQPQAGSAAAGGKRATSPTQSIGGFSSQLGQQRPLGTPGLFSPTAATASGPLWMPRQSITSTSALPGFPFPRLGAHDMDRRSNASSSAYTRGPNQGRNVSPSVAPTMDTSSTSISCQLHFRVAYSGSMTIALRTSIRVNYPSLAFMSLPLNLRLSGLAFEGTLAVAYEGDRKRLHVSILEGNEKATAIGSNLLRNVTVESEVGQADKLVVKDMVTVEQFVQDVARKALEDEIAWPNFQSFAWT